MNEMILSNIANALIAVDKNWRVTQFNSAAEKLFSGDLNKSSLKELLFHKFDQLKDSLPGPDSPSVIRLEMEMDLKTGRGRTVEVVASSLIDANGMGLGYVLLFQDLTKVKSLEKALRQKEKLAAVGQLAAGIAHEIRNPLASISGSIQLLSSESGADEGDSKRLMSITIKEIDRLNLLISEFLEYVRPETAGSEVVDINEILKEILSSVRMNSKLNSNVEQKVQLNGEKVVLGDPSKIKQALLNIVINAYQAMESSESGVLDVKTYDKKNSFHVSISDTGVGIPNEQIGRIFDPFLTTKPSGTGLGLAVTHKILEGHGAIIDVSSEVGIGTNFDIGFNVSENPIGNEMKLKKKHHKGIQMKSRILVVDDEESIREFLEIMLKKEGYEPTCVGDGQEALDMLKKKSFDMIISDLQMPNLTGIELLQKVREQDSEMLFMMITAFGTAETAVEAMKLGAYDYITKPFKIDEVRINISNALKSRNLEFENRNLKRELEIEYSFQNLIGNSESMHKIYEMIRRVSQTPTNILITGESGTGKEMIAKAIHYNGPLKDKPFVPVNCGAIPESLMESEMFGHKKGSFTGAVADKVGMFEVADGGTLFLDEIGELPVSIQVKLLRAIQERVIRRVGSIEDTLVNVRIIAATNRDLQEMVSEQTFRQDLYYRLNVINIHSPPLRERKEDIVLLAKTFLKKYNTRLGKTINGISEEALMVLKKYDYPGNVRELENIIERTVALEGGSSILPESLPPMVNTASGRRLASSHEIEITDEGIELDKVMGQLEKELLIKAIHTAGGVKKRAAKLLNITFRSMRYRVEKYNLGVIGDDEMDDDTL